VAPIVDLHVEAFIRDGIEILRDIRWEVTPRQLVRRPVLAAGAVIGASTGSEKRDMRFHGTGRAHAGA